MNSRSSGGRLEAFFTGKGFYIVLFLCAAIIGGSAWMMAAGERTMAEDIADMNRQSLENHRVETVILPPAQEEIQQAMAPETRVTREEDEGVAPEQSSETWNGEPAAEPGPSYVWPVSGQVERRHDKNVLTYDATMRDWRTHEGIDILAPLGEPVCAAHAGSVESIVQDDLFGTVLTVSHGDGARTVYANLAEQPAVSVGDRVEAGDVIGAVGSTALGEIGQGSHLHFAVTVDGAVVDPLAYLPS